MPPAKYPRKGLTLIEVLIVVAIIAMLSTFVFAVIFPVQRKARDVRRKAEISQMGRFLATGCYTPQAGDGEYDLVTVVDELREKHPRYANTLTQIPRDPLKGTNSESFYRYIVSSTTKKCTLYANLETADEKVTLPDVSSPSAGGGIGVFEASTTGWNGTAKYFQFSN